MANEENLIPFTSEQNREEAKKNGSKGGKASGVARRRKKALKKAIEMIMCLDVDGQTKNVLNQLGIDEQDQSIQTAIVAMQAIKAMRGDVKAAEYLARYGGETPSDILAEKMFKASQESTEKGSNAVDDWVTAVLATDRQEESNGKEQ